MVLDRPLGPAFFTVTLCDSDVGSPGSTVRGTVSKMNGCHRTYFHDLDQRDLAGFSSNRKRIHRLTCVLGTTRRKDNCLELG